MIPGPVEISPTVLAATSVPPPGHTSTRLIEAFGGSIERMRQVWQADAASQPFLLAGSGTLAMEVAAANLVEPGDRALVINTGFFSERMAEILHRAGASVTELAPPLGEAPGTDQVREILRDGPFKALFATHVDTSTGVRIDPEPLCRLAREAGALAVFDGVCAAAGERFEMAAWGADLYFTGSQKALGLPPGLALMVAGERALAARAAGGPRRRRSTSTGTPGSPSIAPTRSASRPTSPPPPPRWSWPSKPGSARSWRRGSPPASPPMPGRRRP